MLFFLRLFLLFWISTVAWAANPLDKFMQASQTPSSATTYLPMHQAFALEATMISPQTIELHWNIAPGYYLFKKSIQVHSENLALTLHPLPQGEEKYDEILGKHQVYTDSLTVTLSTDTPRSGVFSVSYQGCAKAGFCYPPTTQHWVLDINAKTVTLQNTNATPENSVTLGSSERETIQSYFFEYSTPIVLVMFFGLGLLLSFTPCVLPMVPILSAILVGQGEAATRQKTFAISFTYWLSTAFTYSVAGIITALAGKSVQAFLQNPWVLGFVALILVALAFSLFGWYELRLPSRLAQKIEHLSTAQNRNTLTGVAFMGMLSALVVSPCVTAPLLGALTYIATTHNALLGGAALFLLGLGMGFPLFLLGTFGFRLLPKAGAWMRYLQYFLGVLLIGLAIFLMRPFLPTITLNWNTDQHAQESISYQSITSIAALDNALKEAKKAHTPVMIDFYADWCTSCLVLEKTVFQDSQIISLLSHFTVLRVDVTKSTPQTDALQTRFLAFAPPTFIFFDKNGQEQTQAEITGEAPIGQFVTSLSQTLNHP